VSAVENPRSIGNYSFWVSEILVRLFHNEINGHSVSEVSERSEERPEIN